MKYRVILLGSGFNDISFRIFIIWATVGLVITGLDISILTVENWSLPEWLKYFFIQCLLLGDFIFNLLAALVVVLLYSQWIGWGRALAGLFLVGFCGAMAEWVGTQTGFPFGDYHYTANMGPMIAGKLPWAIPLAWWSVVGGFHLIFRTYWNALGPWSTALLVGAAATLFDWVMEPYAWEIKGYWHWHGNSVPLLNYISWFVLSAIFSIVLNAIGAIPKPKRSVAVWQAIVTLALMTTIFLLGRAVQ
ncbi:MAG: carotenoid biosynthesis protein [Verrucomicrobiota bacterium]